MIRYEVFSDHFAHRKNYLTDVDTRAKMLLAAAAIIIVVSSRHPHVPLIVFSLCLVFLLGIRIPPKVILLSAMGFKAGHGLLFRGPRQGHLRQPGRGYGGAACENAGSMTNDELRIKNG